jgi:hypothetical protein
MSRPKSFLPGGMRVDFAGRSHNCQHSSLHRIVKGEPRLKVPNGRSFDHYCVACGLRFIERDLDRLKNLSYQLVEARRTGRPEAIAS